MKLIINEKKEMPLLSRTEVHGELLFDQHTPSKADVAKQLTTTLKADQKLIVVKNIFTQYGEKKARLLAYVYNDAAALKKIEPRDKKAEKATAEKKDAPKEEKKAEPKPEEKPTEEKKETADEKKEQPAQEKKAEPKEEKQAE